MAAIEIVKAGCDRPGYFRGAWIDAAFWFRAATEGLKVNQIVEGRPVILRDATVKTISDIERSGLQNVWVFDPTSALLPHMELSRWCWFEMSGDGSEHISTTRISTGIV